MRILLGLGLAVFTTKMVWSASSQDLIVKFKKQSGISAHYNTESLSRSLNIHLLKSTESSLAVDMVTLASDPNVQYVQFNHKLSLRNNNPNDPSFDRQWSLDSSEHGSIRASEAWVHSIGGKDKRGREIVVAVIDGGFDVNHPDLKNNLWVNANEIPGNGIDDDKNGYIDDITGWNAYTDSGKITSSTHGTHVAGIIGAEGNNQGYVTGVNWDVKVMTISGSSMMTSDIVKAYGYALEQKKLWIKSKGAKGANVVATNSSFGVDYANCESGDYPVWNDLYNQMGEVGILSAAATINSNTDVDDFGDVPTGCSSPYIIAVTNTTRDNEKYDYAGHGKKSIDLGAPGTDILSTVPVTNFQKEGIDFMTGTSMATPHVAGVVGWLHSVASEKFLEEYDSDPGKTALRLKEILLGTVEKMPSLKNKTLSGGKLDMNNAYLTLKNQF